MISYICGIKLKKKKRTQNKYVNTTMKQSNRYRKQPRGCHENRDKIGD